MAASERPIIETRHDQMFQVLEPAEIDRVRRFGETRFYRAGERLTTTGEVGPGMFVILAGNVVVTQRDELASGCRSTASRLMTTASCSRMPASSADRSRRIAPASLRSVTFVPDRSSGSRLRSGRAPRWSLRFTPFWPKPVTSPPSMPILRESDA